MTKDENSCCARILGGYADGMQTNQPTTLSASIDEITATDSGIYMMLSCGKVQACVNINAWEIRVTCCNASNRVWRGAGRGFATLAEAVAAYKKPEMKAIIIAADARNA